MRFGIIMRASPSSIRLRFTVAAASALLSVLLYAQAEAWASAFHGIKGSFVSAWDSIVLTLVILALFFEHTVLGCYDRAREYEIVYKQ